MSKRLFITEKPSVAMQFAKALGVSGGKKNGYLEDDDTVITWCVGHLIEMSYPEKYDPDLKSWSLDTLPFIPDKYRYEVIGSSAAQYKVVAGLLNRKDIGKIYYSGDSAREGEYIQRLVRQCAGHNPKAEEFRVWIDSQTEEEIKRGIAEAKPLSYYDTLSDSAYARAIEDYLVGINFSRVLSLKYARTVSDAVGDKYHAIAVGRVMSCVLGMVVARERQIRDFRAVTYYTIQADLGNELTADWKITETSPFANTPDNYNNTGLLDEVPVKELLAKLQAKGSLTLTDQKKTTQSKMPPLLFNLAELQSECSKVFKISPSETLQIAQSLYEKKLTTYPRTDARVLTTAVTKEISQNLKGLKSVAALSEAADTVLSNNWHDAKKMEATKYVDDARVSDHYAIIPTGETSALSGLSSLEKDVYEMIAKRFLAIFYPAAKYEKVSYTLTGEGETFTGSVTRLVSPGYLALYGQEADRSKDAAFAAAEALSGEVPSEFTMKTGKSKAPSRYTTGSLILAMENAGNLIEDAELREQIKGSGIGTSATRAAVIEKLEANQYIKSDKKSQTVTPLALGEIIYDVLEKAVPNILNPAYTASWEKGLQGIVDGNVTKDHYLEKIYAYVRGGVASMKQADYRDAVKEALVRLKEVYPSIRTDGGRNAAESAYTCPLCGKPVRENQKSYYCSGYRDGCKFTIWKKVAEKTLPESAIKTMIETWESDGPDAGHSAETKEISGFQFKSGKGKAKLRLTMKPGERMKTEFVFEKRN